MVFILTIDLDNAAFEDDPDELGILIREVSHDVGAYIKGDTAKVLDSNGNTVGKWVIK